MYILQALGHDALVLRIQQKFEICHRIYSLVKRYDCLRILVVENFHFHIHIMLKIIHFS